MALVTTSTGSARPATSADVAVHAGVSRSTVSNILNGHDARYPESTRQRVRDAAAALDYRPSLAGRTGLYDHAVKNQNGELIALFRGRSHRLGERKVFEA